MNLRLNRNQKKLLSTLVSLYKKKRSWVSAREVASLLDRNTVVVRNQMQALRALGLVESVPGPKGGYIPTAKAYEALSFTEAKKVVKVPVRKGGKILDLIAEELSFPFMSNPDLSLMRVRVIGDVREIAIGDTITVGPTPLSRLLISGKVRGIDNLGNVIIIDIESIVPENNVQKLPINTGCR